MSRTVALTLLVALLLSACAGTEIKADVADNPQAQATKALVEKFIETNLAYDSEGLISMYADDLVWMDYGGDDGPLTKNTLDYLVRESFSAQDFKYEFGPYMVTSDGRFAVLNVEYSEISPLSGDWVAAPCVVVLEFEDGQIINETWYYNDAPLH
jgi:ketosteroid isomerase-like protein